MVTQALVLSVLVSLVCITAANGTAITPSMPYLAQQKMHSNWAAALSLKEFEALVPATNPDHETLLARRLQPVYAQLTEHEATCSVTFSFCNPHRSTDALAFGSLTVACSLRDVLHTLEKKAMPYSYYLRMLNACLSEKLNTVDPATKLHMLMVYQAPLHHLNHEAKVHQGNLPGLVNKVIFMALMCDLIKPVQDADNE